MESPETTTSNKQASLNSDPRLALVRQRHAELRDHLENVNATFQTRSSSETHLSHVFQYIESTFFYESSARFGFTTRLNRFYSSLQIGDRFVAKVTSVFERSADVRIIWSPKRDVRDLKVKAVLRMVESKRYNNGYRSSESYRRQNSDAQQNRNLDVSELIFVELINFSEVNRKMEVVRCNSLVKSDDRSIEESQEDEDTMLNEDKYLAKSSSESFHEYMMNHHHLNNPALIKHQICSSLLHRKLVIQSYEEKLAESRKRSVDNTTAQEDDVILEERKVANENVSAGNKRKRSETHCQMKNSPKSISNNSESSKSLEYSYSEGRKRTSVTSERTDQIHKERRRARSSSSSSIDSSSDSSSSSDDSRKRHKHKKHKHKGRSKKHSKKSKKKKSRKHRKRDSSDQRSKSPKPKKIDNKILELLNMTK